MSLSAYHKQLKKYLLRIIYKGKVNIFITSGGIYQCYNFLKYSGDKDIFIFIINFPAEEWYFKNEIREIKKLGLNIDNFYYLCNYEKQREIGKSADINTVFVTSTCFVDWDFWKLTDTPKLYDSLLVSRPTAKKRPLLANKISNLAIAEIPNWAKGFKGSEAVDMDKIPCSFRSCGEPLLEKQEMLELFNSSYSTVCLSVQEGACRSSSESLLCGVPVISTSDSTGGREVFYNEDNSILCHPDENSVKEAVELIVKKSRDGKIDREKIRKNYIEKALSLRKTFYKLLDDILLKNDIKGESGEVLFLSSYSKEGSWMQYYRTGKNSSGYSLEEIKEELNG